MCLKICFLVSFSNFSELPVGSVCVTDIQFKGRGKNFLNNVVLDSKVSKASRIRNRNLKLCVIDEHAGRTKNVWESPKGCLMYSFTLEMEDGRVVPLVQYVVSLAVTEAVKDVCDKKVCS